MTALRSMLVAGSLLAMGAFATNPVMAADLSGVPSGKYQVDPTHAYIQFSYNHLGLSNPVLGFDKFSIDLNLNAEEPTQSTVSVVIDVNSVITGSAIWTDHFTGAKWLDVANHDSITFVSSGIEAARDGKYTVSGSLTIKGQSQPASLEVVINGAMNHPMSGNPTVGLQANGELLRSVWGLGNLAPNISDEVTLHVTAELGLAK